MSIKVLMPALSPTMDKGNLKRWLKSEGDNIKPGDVLAEIETDKATMEVEAVDEGVLAKILVPGGTDDVQVNREIALIAEAGEDPKALAAEMAAQSAGAVSKVEPAVVASALHGVGAPAKAAPAQPVASSGESGARIFASPLARRLAKQSGIDLTKIEGSGPHGRIVERDLRGAPRASQRSQPQAAPVQPALSDAAIKRYFAPDSFVEIPHDMMRRTIARRLVEAVNTIPHFYLSVDCELDALLKLRGEINAAAPKAKNGTPAYKISVNDMIIKALAMALVCVPKANVTFTESALLQHRHADVSVAVALPDGLITPVVRQADVLPLSAISNAMKDFAARAKERRLKPEEYEGGVSAVSNLGMFGIKQFAAVINPPQSSILAIGTGEERAVVKNGALVAAQVMSATMSFDHRAIDGATGAELLASFKRAIENPLTLLGV
ncbi:MAG TPA: pyruvate dehydrogenase complex dihydrolipoamide acetyltransferase [Methylovirgula sp.]|nr:pyruvate dehydrogenase complex dihydrolipoamide acetyltransferase [Methylovirgula sp.]